MRPIRPVLLLAPLLFSFALLAQTIMPRGAETLPLFARKYSMPCTQCHMAFPRLNAFGVKFRQNGYRLEGAKGDSPWEDTSFPLSLIGNVGIDYARTNVDAGGGTRVTTTTSETPPCRSMRSRSRTLWDFTESITVGRSLNETRGRWTGPSTGCDSQGR